MNFGYLLDEPASFEVMDAAFDAGVILYDTAHVYGGPKFAGHEEGVWGRQQTVGRWFGLGDPTGRTRR